MEGVNYLGIHIQRKVSWKKQIEEKENKNQFDKRINRTEEQTEL